MILLYNCKRLLFVIFIILLFPSYGSEKLSEYQCFFRSIDQYFHTLFIFIPVKNKDMILKNFSEIKLSKYNLNYPSFLDFVGHKDTKIYEEKTNGGLAFLIIHNMWRVTIPKFLFIKFKIDQHVNSLKRLKRYISYMNDFTAHTQYSYNYNHYDNRKTEFIYLFYSPNGQVWLSIPYMVGLNKKSLLNIRYQSDYCSKVDKK